ncbi:ABC transporter ATP-binding protein, partial [uncultured Allobaculum sp.]
IGAGGYLIATGKMQAAELAAFALYVNVFIGPIDILLEFADSLMKGFTGFRRFEEVMETKPQITEKPDARSLENVKGDIAFDHVSFRYDDDTPVLDQVSFEIPAGGRYALAGPSGSGKSTICSLILRFYDVTGGAVRIDGVDIRDLTLESLRQQIGVVTQDVYLFDGTIADNIRYGKWDATEEEVLEAARKASLAEFIESLPDGLQTRVGEKGTRLSGGQKQRISIARIFLKDPKIVILDEATSALDNESEYYIQQALEKLTENRTSLTIAHRLSTIENADRILVVDGEGISESGTHEELIAQNGLYASYVFRQFGPHETH